MKEVGLSAYSYLEDDTSFRRRHCCTFARSSAGSSEMSQERKSNQIKVVMSDCIVDGMVKEV